MAEIPTPTRLADSDPNRRGLWIWAVLAVAAFHVAYLVPPLGLLMGVYLYGLVKLTEVGSARRAFYMGFGVGMACVVPELWFFSGIFHLAALALWAVGAIWIGFFVFIGWGLRRVVGIRLWAWVWALPVVWTGLEYFRCELYYLKFAWLTPGIAMGGSFLGGNLLVNAVGVYGAGFVMMFVAGVWSSRLMSASTAFILILMALLLTPFLLPSLARARVRARSQPQVLSLVVGIQLEQPSTAEIVEALDTVVSAHPDVALIVMSEYSLGGPPPETICGWCRRHERYLLIGGIQPLPPLANGTEQWADTAFVIDPKGDVVFTQGKSVPIQFFADGVPAREQRLWESPWGKIGICICYDLSYTRVTDELVRQGAQLLIVPTMDAEHWGAYEHGLHARIAPVRALEYELPIVRVGSSGISQIVARGGFEMARGSYPGHGEMVSAKILGYRGFAARLPPDRNWATLCVVLTAGIVITLLGGKSLTRINDWRRKRRHGVWQGRRD